MNKVICIALLLSSMHLSASSSNPGTSGTAYYESARTSSNFKAITFATLSVALLTGLIINANSGSKSNRVLVGHNG